VPDVYQGHETVALTLVDPDNRRPVDYAALERDLAALERMPPEHAAYLAETLHDGRAKLWVTWRLLTLRRHHPALFGEGSYLPLDATGARADHVVAFARRQGGSTLMAIAGRLYAKLLDEPGRLPLGEAIWDDTSVAVDAPEGARFTNLMTGESVVVEAGRVPLAAALSRFPAAALLHSADATLP
jgi:(1->4)-alpha-D-glucan 1-alpha-D-glucosylmutase